MTFFWLILWIWLIVGTFFWYFDFFSESLGRQNLNIRLGPSGGAEAGAEPLGPSRMFKFCRPSDSEKNQNTQKKVPTTQPNPQYSAKNNVTMHMIDTFMPPPFHILACLKYSMIIFQQYLAKLYSNLSKYSCLFLIRFIYKNVCTNTYVWGKMTFILFVSV